MPASGVGRRLSLTYRLLCNRFGPAGWWPGKTPFEIALGAILVQNTSWAAAERAVETLRRKGLLSFAALRREPLPGVESAIRPAGMPRVKARRVAAFLEFLERECGGRVGRLADRAPLGLRSRLLAVDGIGPETADCILLYAARHPFFVVDAYTRRVFSRMGLVSGRERYDDLQRFFMESLPRDVGLFNDYHAQIVRLAKEHCFKSLPACATCPLGRICARRGV